MFGLITAAIPLIGKLIDSIFGNDSEESKKAKFKLAEMQVSGELEKILGQLEINKVEAQHKSIFVAGWRPFVGWCGGVAFAYHAVLAPLIAYVAALSGYPVALPELDTTLVYFVLGGMLGIGGMRSFDKMKGTDTKRVEK